MRRAARPAALCLALASLLAFSTSPGAQGGAKGEGEMLFKRGAAHFKAGRYTQAIEDFEAAHEVLPNPLLLYNLALAHARLDQIPEALAASSDAALDGGLSPKVASRNHARISAFTTILNAREVAARITRLGDDPPGVATSEGSGTSTWVGIGSLAIGGALTLGALVVNKGLDDDVDRFESAAARGDSAAYNSARREIEDGQLTGRALLFTGLGLGAVGAALLLFGGESDEASPVSVSVSPLGGEFKVSW